MTYADKFVDNDGVRIHYEVEDGPAESPVIVFVHGMGMSTRDWRNAGYPEKLSGEFKVALMDSRGFGQSDKLADPAQYGRAEKVSDVVAVLDDLGVEKAYYWGFSMGASIGWAVGMLAPHRFHGLILGAYPVLSPDVPEIDRVRWEARAKLMRLGMDVYVAAMEMDQGPLPQAQRDRLLSNDKDAYAAQQIANLHWGAPDDANPQYDAARARLHRHGGQLSDAAQPRTHQALRVARPERATPRARRPHAPLRLQRRRRDDSPRPRVHPARRGFAVRGVYGGSLEQVGELLKRDASLAEDFRQSTALDRVMAGIHRHDAPSLMMHEDMLALPLYRKSRLLQGADYPLMRKVRRAAHRLTTTVRSMPPASASICSHVSSQPTMASLMFSNASSTVSPSDTHPRRPGAKTVKPPSSAGSSATS